MKRNGNDRMATSDRMTRQLFASLLPIYTLASGLPALNSLFGTFILGNYIGSAALAAIGFTSPLLAFVSAVTRTVSTGSQVLCGRHLGRGDHRGVIRTFNTSLPFALAVGVLLGIFCCALPGVLTRWLGAQDTAFALTAEYLRGYGIGIAFNIFFTCLLPYLQLDRAEKLSSAAVAVMVFSNIGFNLVNVFWLKWGIFGVGLAASAANILSVLVALPHFFFRSKVFRFSLLAFRLKELGSILYYGSSSAVTRLCATVRNRILNAMVYALGGVSAMSALSVAITLSESIGMSIDGGYSGASALIGSVLVGERDVDSLRELPRDMIRVTGPVFASAYALLFIFAKPLAVLFGAESGDVALFVTAIRLYNLWFFTDVIKCSAACLYRALGQVKEVCIYMALQNLAFPALVCWLGKHIGLWFVLCHQWIAEGLLILVFIGIYAVHAGHLPRSIFRITWVPSSLAVPAADRYSTSIRSREDVSRASEELNAFCLRRGLPSRTAYFAALCVEELAADTVQHGFSQCKKAGIIDLRVFHEDGKLSLLLRDNCPPFDPSEWLKLCAPDEPERSVGIRLVSRCAEEMEYAAAIGLNVVKIRL